MEKDYFEKHYPHITELYNDYINTEAYQKHPLVQTIEPYTSEMLNKAYEQLEAGEKIKASDLLTESAITYEQSGFILGFSLAMNFIQESIVRKAAK